MTESQSTIFEHGARSVMSGLQALGTYPEAPTVFSTSSNISPAFTSAFIVL